MVTIEAFDTFTGIVAPLDRRNVDTDAIIPKQFLKRVEKTGFGKYLFYDWRYDSDGEPDGNFVLNQAPYTSSSILLSRENFGCGSSREHAPWALRDFGFKTIIAPSFADIFYNNCFENGILPVKLSSSQVDLLFENSEADFEYSLTVDLEARELRDSSGLSLQFDVDDDKRRMLLEGLDRIDLTLENESDITEFENSPQAPPTLK